MTQPTYPYTAGAPGLVPYLRSKAVIWVLIGSLSGAVATSVIAQTDCGPLRTEGQYGPFDFRTDHDKLPIVLGAHFTPPVEALIRGTTSRSPGGDIDYTLRAIPNYHRALIAMMKLGQREKSAKPVGSRYTIDCWFERAVQFAPNDAIVRMIYSTYLNSRQQVPEAIRQLETATLHAKDSGFTHYNIGLHYFDLKNYELALASAHQAIALGFTQAELADLLRKEGKWVDPKSPSDAAAKVAPRAVSPGVSVVPAIGDAPVETRK